MVYLVAALVLMMLVVCSCATVNNSKIVSSISKALNEQNFTYGIYDEKNPLLEIEKNESNNTETIVAKPRFKRQQSSGAGKFTEAAQLPQLKLLRLFLTMFKNLWAPSHTGGSNPFHPYVPKPIVMLYKEKIVEFFLPDIGEEALRKN